MGLIKFWSMFYVNFFYFVDSDLTSVALIKFWTVRDSKVLWNCVESHVFVQKVDYYVLNKFILEIDK